MAPSDAEEVLAIRLREAAVSFGEIGGDRDRSAVQLVSEETVTSRELLGRGKDMIGEIDGLLVDVESLEGEGHAVRPAWVEKGER